MPIDLGDINAAMASARRGGLKRKAAPKARMAADNVPPDLDKLLSDIREESKEEALESAIQDATVYLNRQYGIEDQFMAAGLSQPQARMVEALGELEGRGVPSAFIHSPSRGVEQRVHTRYGVNPLTGQQEIVPFQVDGKTLVTNLGRGVPMNGHNKAMEYVQEQAMLLAGLPVQRNNATTVHAPDFRVGNQLVDGEIREVREGRNIPIQLYTDVAPSNSRGMNQYEIRDQVSDLIKDRMRSTGQDVITAVDSLSRDRILSNHTGRRPPVDGKLLKTKPGERIDQLIMPSYTTEQALANKQRDQIAMAPQDIRMVNLDAANDAIVGMNAQELAKNMQVRANMGNNRDGARGRVYVRVDQNAPGVSYDLADRYPYAAQLYA